LRLLPGGQEALVLDANFPENGGGLYRVRVGCDGTLTDLGRWTPGKLLRGLVPLPGEARWVAAAREILSSPPGDDLHLLRVGTEPDRVTGVDAFGDDEAIVSALAVTGDGRYLLVGDNNAFSGIPNRVAVAAVTTGGLSRVQILSPIQDPVAIVVSPFGNAVLVASGFGNALLRLSYDPQSRTPFVNRGALSYQGARPALPANLAPLERGMLRGRVLVAENLGVRQVQFEADGAIRDLGVTSTGRTGAAVVGIVGVEP
jgi:DNA-binding beta-propeller fold protein YncE